MVALSGNEITHFRKEVGRGRVGVLSSLDCIPPNLQHLVQGPAQARRIHCGSLMWKAGIHTLEPSPVALQVLHEQESVIRGQIRTQTRGVCIGM